MNKDLASVSAIWRALGELRDRHFKCFICVLVVLLSKSRRRCFAADFGSVSGDGRSFRCCTVGELLRELRFGVCEGGDKKKKMKKKGGGGGGETTKTHAPA